MVKIYYDSEGDLLEILFAQTTKARRGIGLTDQITLFYDEKIEGDSVELEDIRMSELVHP